MNIRISRWAAGISLVIAGATGSGWASTISVTPGNTQGWDFYTTDADGNIVSNGNTSNIAAAPAPLFGFGSDAAHLQTTDHGGSAAIRLSGWGGTSLGDLNALSYSTYGTQWNGTGGQMTYLTLYLDTDGNGSVDNHLYFEPVFSGTTSGGSQADPSLGHWQTWNLLNGNWYDDNATNAGADAKSLAEFAAEFPDAKIVDQGVNGGGIKITAGYAPPDDFNVFVDGFQIGTTSVGPTNYNFAVPEPCGIAMVGFAAAGLLLRRRRVAA